MDTAMIAFWNETVAENDIVYHLGDFGLASDPRKVLARLKGRIWLLRGNHDILSVREWLDAGVEGILPSAWPWSKEVVFTHVPIHPMSLAGRWRVNVHGHIHDRSVMKWERGLLRWKNKPDPRYFNASVEAIDYRPLSARWLARVAQGAGVGAEGTR
jgi:calcineurin-like phosphoesterase family protein